LASRTADSATRTTHRLAWVYEWDSRVLLERVGLGRWIGVDLDGRVAVGLWVWVGVGGDLRVVGRRVVDVFLSRARLWTALHYLLPDEQLLLSNNFTRSQCTAPYSHCSIFLRIVR